MTIGKRKGSAAKGTGGTGINGVNKVGGSLSKGDHFYLQEDYKRNSLSSYNHYNIHHKIYKF